MTDPRLSMISRRRLLQAGALGGTAAALAACGAQSPSTSAALGSSSPAPSVAPASAAPTAAVEDFNGVTLNVFSGNYIMPALELAADRWATRTGGQTVITPIPFADRPAKLAGIIASQDPSWDLIYQSVGLTQRFGERVMLDLTGRVDTADFLPLTIDTLTLASSGKLAGLPISNEQMYFFYNKEHFDAIGENADAPPATWEELFTLTPKFKENGIIPMGLCWLAASYGNFYWTFFINALRSSPLISPDLTQIDLANDDVLRSFEVIDAGFKAGFWDPSLMSAANEHDIGLLLYSEKMACHLGWAEHWNYATSGNVADYQATIDPASVGATIVPGIDPGTSASVNGVEGLGVSAFSQQQDAAISFLVELTSAEGQRADALSDVRYPPARESVFQDEAVREHLGIPDLMVDQAAFNHDMHVAPYDLAPVFDEAIAKLYKGEYTPEQAHEAAIVGCEDAIIRWLSS